MSKRKEFKSHLYNKKKNDSPPSSMDEFELEALEGWKESEIDEEKYNQILSELDSEIDKKIDISPSSAKKIRKILPLSLAAALLLLVSIWGVNRWMKPSHNELIYASYFDPLMHPDAPKRSGDNHLEREEIEQKAIHAYEAEDYRKSINYYEDLTREYPNNTKHALFLGISYMGVGNMEKAIHVFSKLENVDPKYKQDISWYMALAYLRNNQKNAALIILESLSKQDGYYTSGAKDIIAELQDTNP